MPLSSRPIWSESWAPSLPSPSLGPQLIHTLRTKDPVFTHVFGKTNSPPIKAVMHVQHTERIYRSATLSFYINLQCICRRKLLFPKHSLAHTNTRSPDRQGGVSLTVKYCRPIRALIIKKTLFLCATRAACLITGMFVLKSCWHSRWTLRYSRLHGPFLRNTRYTASVYASFASRSTQTVTFPLREKKKHRDCLKPEKNISPPHVIKRGYAQKSHAGVQKHTLGGALCEKLQTPRENLFI